MIKMSKTFPKKQLSTSCPHTSEGMKGKKKKKDQSETGKESCPWIAIGVLHP